MCLSQYSEEFKLPDLRDRDYLVENWQFDPHIYTQDELFTLFIYMMDKLGVTEHFDIPRSNLINFCRSIAKNYRKNPYHNFQHAFDVAQMCFKLVYKTKAMEFLTPSDLLVLILSALCHDTDHPGNQVIIFYS
jgi:high affinity cGMP-specific 3',5'-cyclic phosphodiesterase 9